MEKNHSKKTGPFVKRIKKIPQKRNNYETSQKRECFLGGGGKLTQDQVPSSWPFVSAVVFVFLSVLLTK